MIKFIIGAFVVVAVVANVVVAVFIVAFFPFIVVVVVVVVPPSLSLNYRCCCCFFFFCRCFVVVVVAVDAIVIHVNDALSATVVNISVLSFVAVDVAVIVNRVVVVVVDYDNVIFLFKV